MTELDRAIRTIRPDDEPAPAVVRGHLREVRAHVVHGSAWSSAVADDNQPLRLEKPAGIGQTRRLWVLVSAVAGVAVLMAAFQLSRERPSDSVSIASGPSEQASTSAEPHRVGLSEATALEVRPLHSPVLVSADPTFDIVRAVGFWDEDSVAVHWNLGDRQGSASVTYRDGSRFDELRDLELATGSLGPETEVMGHRALVSVNGTWWTVMWISGNLVYSLEGPFPTRQALEVFLLTLSFDETRTWQDLGLSVERLDDPVPSTTSGPELRIYIVQPGDSLSVIAVAFGVTVNSLQEANELDGIDIHVGQQLIIPDRVPAEREAVTTEVFDGAE